MLFQLIRHATCFLEYGGRQILVDPVFAGKGDLPPIPLTPKQRRNPLTDLPISATQAAELAEKSDLVLVTHTHIDHLDAKAISLLPKTVPFVCQPADTKKLKEHGFSSLLPLDGPDPTAVDGINLRRFGGHHGKGLIGKMMGQVSGYFLSAPGEPSVYFPGDTLWCREVKDAIEQVRPDVIVMFTGAAQFALGAPITMSEADVAAVADAAPEAILVAVHMEAINHCQLTRNELRLFAESKGFSHRLRIPEDGESFILPISKKVR